MKLLLFDIDGTLVLTGGAGLHALNRAFQQVAGIFHAMDGIRPHGKTDPAIVREVFAKRGEEDCSAGTISQILDAYVSFLAEEVETSGTYRVLPGIQSFLARYATQKDLALGLATGNVESGARIKLARGNLNTYFKFGGFGSDSEQRADLVRRSAERGRASCGTNVSPDEIFVIGDTPRDIEAGRAAGFKTIGVATSDYSVQVLEDSGADLAMRSFEEDLGPFLKMTRIG